MGVMELGVPKCLGWRRLGVEKSPLTGGPPGFSDDGVLMFAALGVRKPPTGLGVATAGAGEAAICPMERFILEGDIRPEPYNFSKIRIDFIVVLRELGNDIIEEIPAQLFLKT